MKRSSGVPGTGLERTIRWLLCGLLTVYALHMAFIAWRLPIDYWDGYEYLMNARHLAGHDMARFGCGYLDFRPPLVSLLLAPVLLGYAPAGGGTSLWGPRTSSRWR